MTLTSLANNIYVQFGGNPCIQVHETWCQLGVWSCTMPGLPRHLLQELNVGTVVTTLEKDKTSHMGLSETHKNKST